ncbi:hypothetical protein [Frankia sp. EAN1pec]|uniref:caspase, EACC1-associated type n=1 Tax=Parafrankia sp. (strain EAN1pec) TaxID=298653 RepID=UPI0012F766E9
MWDLKETLVEQCGVPGTQIDVLLDPENPLVFVESIEAAARKASRGLVIWYVGHGLVDLDNELYLATYATKDLTEGRAVYQALPFAEVQRAIVECTAPLVAIVLDCCFGGRATVPSRLQSSAQIARAGLSGVYLLTASAWNEHALAPVGSTHTAFTGSAIDLFTAGDAAGGPVIRLDDLYTHLRKALPEQNCPLPRRWAVDEVGDLILAPNVAFDTARRTWRRSTDRNTEEGELRKQVCPWPGLAFYSSSDQELFFGRERLTQELMERVTSGVRERSGPIAVVGASGTGKSSLLHAGLLPALASGEPGVPAAASWPYLVITPGANPIGNLAARISMSVGVSSHEAEQILRSSPAGLERLVDQLLVDSGGQPPRQARLLLIVDQFEELFLLCDDEDDRKLFIRAITAGSPQACENEEPVELPMSDRDECLFTTILGIRADVFGACSRYPELAESLRRPLLVGPMSEEDIRRTLEGPAQVAGLRWESGLIEHILAEFLERGRSEAGTLPLLSHAMRQTWIHSDRSTLLFADYHESGGVRRAIATTAESCYAGMGDLEQDVARNIFLRMVRLQSTDEPTRRRLPLTDLPPTGAHQRVLGRLVQDRLVSVDRGSCEIVHEALLREWPRLRDWISRDQERLRARDELVGHAEAWERSGRDDSRLYRGAQLGRIRERLATPSSSEEDLPEPGPSFLAASVAHQAELDAEAEARVRGDRRTSRRLRQLTAGLAILTVLAVAGASAAIVQRGNAVAERDAASQASILSTADGLVARADAARDVDPLLSLRLGIAARAVADNTRTQSGLLETITDSPYIASSFAISDPFLEVAVSPDSHLVAVGGVSGKIELWNIVDPRRPKKQYGPFGLGDGVAITQITFDPQSSALAVVTIDKVTLWDISNPTAPRPFGQVQEDVLSFVKFSPSGEILVVASPGMTSLWDVTVRDQPERIGVPVVGNGGAVWAVTFSPDGRLLATGDNIGYVLVMDVSDPRSVATLGRFPSPQGTVTSLAFVGDDEHLAVGAGKYDGNIIMMDIDNPGAPIVIENNPLRHFTKRIVGLDTAKGSDFLFAASENGELVAWNVSDSEVPYPVQSSFAGHTQSISGLDLAEDGRILATAGVDGTTILWDIAQPTEPRQVAGITTEPEVGYRALATNRSGTLLAGGRSDGSTLLWDITHLDKPRQITTINAGSEVNSLALTGDGGMLAVGHVNGDVALWNIRDAEHPELITTKRSGLGLVTAVEFNKPGDLLAIGAVSATGSRVDDASVTLWRVNEREPSAIELYRGSDAPQSLSFSPDSDAILVGFEGGTSRLWQLPANSTTMVTELPGHSFEVAATDFDDRSKLAATGNGNSNGKVLLWDATDLQAVHRVGDPLIDPDQEVITEIEFSPGESMLAVGGTRQYDMGQAVSSVRLWNLDEASRPRSLGTIHVSPTNNLSDLAIVQRDGAIVTATAFPEGGIQIWDAKVLRTVREDAIKISCQRAERGLNEAEWAQYVPGLPYRATC